MSSTKIFYTEDGKYFSEEYNRAIVDEVAFGGELNHTKLYGSQEIFRSPLPYLFVSSTVSDANGVLQSKKNVGMELQDVNGLTVIFDAAGGTHPKKMDVVLISKTLPNFANVYKSQSFKDDLVTRVSDTGFLPGTAFDTATGDRIDHAGTMTTGYITGASDITIRTRGIDWNKVDQKVCGVNLHRKWLSGNRMAPVWYGFATAESLIASTSPYDGFGKMTIDAEGNAVSNVYETSVRTYAMKLLEKQANNAKVATLLVDMLNYGAEAQKYFKYNEEDLANSLLTAEQQAKATQSVTCVNKHVKGENVHGTNLSLEDSIILNLFFKNVKAGYTAKIVFTDYRGTIKTLDKELIPYTGSVYKIVVDDIVLADAFSTVTATVYDANGNVHGTPGQGRQCYRPARG